MRWKWIHADYSSDAAQCFQYWILLRGREGSVERFFSAHMVTCTFSGICGRWRLRDYFVWSDGVVIVPLDPRFLDFFSHEWRGEGAVRKAKEGDLRARDTDALCSCTTRIGCEEHAVVTRQLCMPMLAASVSPMSCTLHRMHAELNTERASQRASAALPRLEILARSQNHLVLYCSLMKLCIDSRLVDPSRY